jgi:hypothetical protein
VRFVSNDIMQIDQFELTKDGPAHNPYLATVGGRIDPN